MLLKPRASPDMLPLSLCNKKMLAVWHTNGLLFPATLSILSYEMGKWAGLRTNQHPHVVAVVFCVHSLWELRSYFECLMRHCSLSSKLCGNEVLLGLTV